jgi:hypothetical protein
MLTLSAPKRYQDLYERYTEGSEPMSTNDVMELFQFLLDTDQVWDDDQLARTAQYYISEGFLYHVETQQ